VSGLLASLAVMCHDADAIPPIYGPALTAATGTPVVLTSDDGASFRGYLAEPADPSGTAVLVLPDNRGLSGFYEHLAVRLAEQRYAALAIDYFGRGPGLFTLTRDGLYADFAAGIAYLSARPATRTVASLGFCLGGRFAFLTADRQFGLSAAVGLYGMPDPIAGAPGPTQLAGRLGAPILGLFGGADAGIPPEMVARFDEALRGAGVPHEIVTYPGAPHSFFESDRPEYATAQADAWRRILAFLAER
jgi:carboxymethylenebutenolidase